MSSAIRKSLRERIRSLIDYSVLLFNTMFALLSTGTLLGIIFITRPQQPMHDIPPHWWIPLAVVMIPGQLYAQYVSWKTVLRFRTPSPLEIAKGFRPRRWWTMIPFAFYWGANFLIGFAIVVSLFKPQPGNPASIPETLLVAFVTFALTACANVYLMLLVKTTFKRESALQAIWKYRFAIDFAIAVVAMIYYQI